MTEEEIKALQDAKAEAERKAQEAERIAAEAKAEAEKAKLDVTKVVDELKEERRKKQEALDNANINKETPDVNSLIEQALATKEQERRKTELEEAIAEFKGSKTEFQTDTAGLVFEKFKKELGKFNFSDVTNKAQAKARLEEVYRFVNNSKPEDEGIDYDGTTRAGHDVPKTPDVETKEVKSALELARMDKDKYTKLKDKFGDAFESLGI